MKRWHRAWGAVGIALFVSLAQAQANVRVRGTITAVSADVLSVESRDGRDLTMTNAKVGSVQSTGKRELMLQYKDGAKKIPPASEWRRP